MLTDENMVAMKRLALYLQAAWSKATSADPAHWSYGNPSWGQCAVTALVVQHFFGGEILQLDISAAADPKIAGMGSHYFNKIDSRDFDFSADQFGDVDTYESLLAHGARTRLTKKELLSNPATQEKFSLLFAGVVNIACGKIVLN